MKNAFFISEPGLLVLLFKFAGIFPIDHRRNDFSGAV